MPASVDVLVVGAGPVGLVLACELARRDVPVRIVDRLPRPTDESRAIVVHARSLEMLERMGVVDALIASGVHATGMEFHADGKSKGRVDLTTVDSPYPFSISTPQTDTERVLTERLSELGVGIERGVELVALEQDAQEVRSRLRGPDGREETVTSSWLAGTDGSHSTVRAQVGTSLEGSFKGERFLLADVEADHDLDRTSMHTFFSPRRPPVVAFPMVGSRIRIIAEMDPGDPGDEVTLESMQRVCDERMGGVRLASAHWLTSFEIHHAQVPRYRFGRAFLAGDAAHVHSPAGGQGMNTGMQDAFNLGWKLAAACAGRAGPYLLESYHDERHPVAAAVIEQSTRLTRLATISHVVTRKLRNEVMHLATGLAPISHRLAAEVEETGVAYRDSPIVLDARGIADAPRPGDAAPDVPGLPSPLHRALAAGTGHTALYIAGAQAAPARVADDDAITAHVLVGGPDGAGAGFDVTIPDEERRAARRYAVGDGGGIFIVRPDGYIGLRARLGDDEAVDSYLRLVRG
jgi:2-polyprenyl-6-methoxyphenol hydroxylase-like FAD-dependent oxidoreductase